MSLTGNVENNHAKRKHGIFGKFQAPDEVGSGNFSAYDIYIRWRIKNTILGWKKGKWSLKYCLCFFPSFGLYTVSPFSCSASKICLFFFTFFWKKDATIEANLWETNLQDCPLSEAKPCVINIVCFVKGIDFSQKSRSKFKLETVRRKNGKIDVVKKKNMRNSWL